MHICRSKYWEIWTNIWITCILTLLSYISSPLSAVTVTSLPLCRRLGWIKFHSHRPQVIIDIDIWWGLVQVIIMYASEGIQAPLRVKLCNAWSILYSQILDVISWVSTDESAVKVVGMWYRPCGKRSQVLNDVWWNTWWLWTGRTGRRFLDPPSTETWPLLFLSALQVCALTFWISKVGSF